MFVDVKLGTKNPESFGIDLDDYSTRRKTDLDEYEEKQALKLLRLHMVDDGFTSSGRRNDDAVNTCIALHVLGYNPEEFFENFFHTHGTLFHESDIKKYMEHVTRVCPYLDSWGPVGNESQALDFALD